MEDIQEMEETVITEEVDNSDKQPMLGEDIKSDTQIRRRRFLGMAGVVLLILLIVLVSFALGLLVGKFLIAGGEEEEAADDGAPDWGSTINGGSSVDWIQGTITADNIVNNLRQLTVKPHIAGKEQNKVLADDIYNQWRQYKFDEVEMHDYNVLLSYVNRSNYNSLQLRSSTGDVLYGAETRQEPPLTEGEDDPNVPPPFNAYSGVGKASGPLVYVNYGTIDNFIYITKTLSINITGYICIARYGNIFRGDKAKLAQQFGCSGLIIYSDPLDYAPKGGPPVYPHGPSLPPGGLQRGTLYINNGDPLTPGLPSVEGVARRSYKDAIEDNSLPSIPVQPISYSDALHFMRQLNSHAVPKSWVGELNLTYNILQDSSNTNVTYIEVNNVQERKDIYNVVGTIYGAVEPDRLVILGNHRDAWTFGGADPNSGTATLMEIARVLSTMRENGWRPGRTIVLCSWDAEEYGLLGSWEWVEDLKKLLGTNTVAYLNVDIAVEGRSHFRVSASPLLHELIYDITNRISCPCQDYSSVYDQWKSFYPDRDRPLIGNLGSGSDYTAFLQLIGVSSADLRYTYEGNFSYYAVYHSVHDNFFWMSHFGDPDFTHHAAVGEVWLSVAVAIATTPILPYNVVDYATIVANLYSSLKETYETALLSNNISLSLLTQSLNEFKNACEKFQANVNNYQNGHSIKDLDGYMLRLFNNKMINLERAFIIPEGLPGRPYYKHIVFAPSSVNSYAGSSFPGVVDSIFDAQTDGDWFQVHRQLDFVAVHLRYATQILSQPGVDWIKS